MFIGINIGSDDEAIKFIQRNDINKYEDICKEIKILMKKKNEKSIFLYESSEYKRINSLNKIRKANSKDKYIEYIEENCSKKHMTYSEFIKANYGEDYIDFSFNSYEEYIERVKEKIEEIGKSNNIEKFYYYEDNIVELSLTDYYYKDKIKDYSIDINWSNYIDDYELRLDSRSYYIDELIENIVKKYDFEVYLIEESEYYYEYIIGFNITEKNTTLTFFENFRKDNIEQIEKLKKFFDEDNLEIKVFSKEK